jgi:histidyl-tRNA synthetase
VQLHVNDRRLLGAVLDHVGVPADKHLPVMVVMDKRDKITPEHLESLLAEQGLNAQQVGQLNAILAMRALDEVRAALGGSSRAVDELEALLDLLARVGFGEWIAFDIAIVRGLSYYTGTVFELRDRGATLRAICGGGRYDTLLSTFGGQSIPAIGLGFGDVVILELLADLKLLPELGQDIDFTVIPFSGGEVPLALEVGQALRRQGHRVDVDFGLRKLKRALQRADEIGARQAVLLMPDELAKGELVVREMARREERRVPIASLTGAGSSGGEAALDDEMYEDGG